MKSEGVRTGSEPACPASTPSRLCPTLRRHLFVYLSGPITPAHGFTVAENVASAVTVYLQCCRLGIPAVCPHLSAALPEGEGIDYAQWMALDLALIDRCTHLLLLPRWETSPGAQLEVAYARSKGIPIVGSVEELL